MASSPVPQASLAVADPSRHWSALLGRVMIITLISALLGVLCLESRLLYSEWTLLRAEEGATADSAVIAFYDVAPAISYAQRPAQWIQDHESETLLWQRWVDRVGHRWFHVARGEINPAQITGVDYPLIPRAIDRPVVELGQGEIWAQMPGETMVFAVELGNTTCVYPAPLLAKVLVVNDVVGEDPFLIVFDNHAPAVRAVSVYAARWEGRRATLAPSGYYLEDRPVLFDRRTESLWMDRDGALTAFAGRSKGATMKRLAVAGPTLWSRYCQSPRPIRLIVGADRRSGIPIE